MIGSEANGALLETVEGASNTNVESLVLIKVNNCGSAAAITGTKNDKIMKNLNWGI
ncbi:hypothetical protein [Nitrosomonas sp. Nm51]|uniref:hypothetical protein n=1 Tax=Nitrosomonas sp. Nm51 TaxID=133720 RepID=UPI001C435627|nr:hypothetical protein [Nitrosomonas sp. Nm51]